jgi:short-subunit dehydrogenase
MKNNRFAVVTGASQGIGKEIAEELAKRGFSLILCARDQSRLAAVSKEIMVQYPIEALTCACDLTDSEGVKKLSEFSSPYLSQIDILINNAGFGDLGDFSDRSWDLYQKMLKLNIVSLTELTHFFATLFKKRKMGFILNVASTAAFQPDPYFAVYGATKAYVLSLSEALREELRDSNVQVSVLCPGPTDTPFHERAGTQDSPIIRYSMASAKKVAHEGVEGLLNKKTLIVPGILNRLLILTIRISPRAMVAKLSAWLLKKR